MRRHSTRSPRRRSLSLAARAALGSILLAIPASCHDGGGGGGAAESLLVETVFSGGTGAFPASDVALNAAIVVQCSTEIDPASVSADTVRIETASAVVAARTVNDAPA